ncbi:FAD-dependent oxidoreductase [Microvirga thermotolerans]|uniref:Amine oxidase domain-containing protein n=1 Tax=Microvirga thermotolerans TaxID=2651334 RepID=A0A5P9JZ27_9HYPH|nr:FAD-dependent oxidoreductase [Microvirga thermotolerans]QFU17857.1 hypothetical protein GDR74_17430 [Microvirga thermotolerans]
MVGRTHVVGAGVAGLSAALSALSQDCPVTLYEAAPGTRSRDGGRSPEGETHSCTTGMDVLFAADCRAMALLRSIGAHARWIAPEPEGIPLYDAGSGGLRRVGLSPWSWLAPDRRPPDMRLSDLVRLTRLAFSKEDRSLGDVASGGTPLAELLEPVAGAALNLRLCDMPARQVGQVLGRFLCPGAARLLVPKRGLAEDLLEPALQEVRSRGATVRLGEHLRSVLVNDGRAVGLVFTDHATILGADDRVILALPPEEIGRLLPCVEMPSRCASTLNVHFRVTGAHCPRFVAFRGTLAKRALVRSGHACVTVAAAESTAIRDRAKLASRIWREVAPGFRALGLNVPADVPPEACVAQGPRIPIRRDDEPPRSPPLRPLANLVLAGDWLGPRPGTIEGAVLAGEHAVSVLRHARPGAPVRRACSAGARSGMADAVPISLRTPPEQAAR